MSKRFIVTPRSFWLILLVVGGCTTAYKVTDFGALYGPSAPKQRVLSEARYQQHLQHGAVAYTRDVKPILDSRCVVCHACYDAPCQLKLSSFAGLDRGGSKQPVYDAERMQPAAPTRLFFDATTTAAWRKKGFYPVLNEREDSEVAALDNSLLAKLLQLKRLNPLPESGRLADSFDLDINRSMQCPEIGEFAGYQYKHPLWGMPYAMPALSLAQEYTVLKWLQEGAKTGPAAPLSPQAVAEIAKWERFFNGTSLKQKLVSRYIYEHLFIGHLHFQGHPDDEFYQLVRSKTPPGSPIEPIATLRPYEDPQVAEFYYRVRPIVATIVDKTHFVYELSEQKRQRYQTLFFDPDYTVTRLPSYRIESASNPFKTFEAIPRSSRYKFLLDDAEYFVSGFIKGPVCRGQIALNVIRDRFWVVFLSPDWDAELEITEQFDRFLAEQDLTLPAAAGDSIGLFKWRDFDKLARDYLKKKDAFANQLIANHGGFKIDAIWDGAGVNPNAALTVFRHFDSATVTRGFIGQTPLTGWVIDYPIFERLHYLLVAGFNVYGSVGHQLATRSYMDYLRMGAENNFLRFMPETQRKPIYDSWYRGVSGRLKLFFTEPYYSAGHTTGVRYKTADYKTEFFDQIRTRLGQAAGLEDLINNCRQPLCHRRGSNAAQQRIDDIMRELASLRGRDLTLLPEISFLRVTLENGDDRVYTLLFNEALKNVTIMFAEDLRRLPDEDSLTVVPGFVGSYPNFFFAVAQDQLPMFLEQLKNARSDAAIERFYGTYGIRRSDPKIWALMDWFNARHKQERGLHAGLFDMNRYRNL